MKKIENLLKALLILHFGFALLLFAIAVGAAYRGGWISVVAAFVGFIVCIAAVIVCIVKRNDD